MCDKAMRNDAFSLVCVPIWFVTEEQLKLWQDSYDWHNDDKVIGWYEDYKKRKAQKAKIK